MQRRAPAGQLQIAARGFGQAFDTGGATFFGDGFRRYEKTVWAATTRSRSTHFADLFAAKVGNKREHPDLDQRFSARCAIRTNASSSGGCKGGLDLVVWFVVGAFSLFGLSASPLGPVRDTWGKT